MRKFEDLVRDLTEIARKSEAMKPGETMESEVAGLRTLDLKADTHRLLVTKCDGELRVTVADKLRLVQFVLTPAQAAALAQFIAGVDAPTEKAPEPIFYRYVKLASGGRAVIAISKDGRCGASLCSPNDNFVRAEGKEMASARQASQAGDRTKTCGGDWKRFDVEPGDELARRAEERLLDLLAVDGPGWVRRELGARLAGEFVGGVPIHRDHLSPKEWSSSTCYQVRKTPFVAEKYGCTRPPGHDGRCEFYNPSHPWYGGKPVVAR